MPQKAVPRSFPEEVSKSSRGAKGTSPLCTLPLARRRDSSHLAGFPFPRQLNGGLSGPPGSAAKPPARPQTRGPATFSRAFDDGTRPDRLYGDRLGLLGRLQQARPIDQRRLRGVGLHRGLAAVSPTGLLRDRSFQLRPMTTGFVDRLRRKPRATHSSVRNAAASGKGTFEWSKGGASRQIGIAAESGYDIHDQTLASSSSTFADSVQYSESGYAELKGGNSPHSRDF